MDIITLLIKEDNEYKQLNIAPGDLKEFFLSVSNKDGHLTKDVTMITLAKTEVTEDAITIVMSDESLNTYDFRIKTEGIDLKYYKKNPVLLWSHDRERPAIGKMTNLRKADGKLTGTAVFAPRDVDELAWSIEQKVRLGIITSGSIGFKIMDVDIPKKPRADGTTMIVTALRLDEYSLCNVPANPNATVINTLSIEDDTKDNTEQSLDTVSVPVIEIEYIESLFSNRSRKTSDLEKLLQKEDKDTKSLFGDIK